MRASQSLPILAVLALLWGCTTVDHVQFPGREAGAPVFVLTGDLDAPYQSLGPLQVTRKGVLVVGFIDPAGVNLQATLNDALIPEIRRAGGDGLINLRYEATQYHLPTRVLAALFFFAPLPVHVTLRGELVKLEGSP